jgi:hypothetical protein
MSGSRVSLDGLPNGYRRDRALSNHGYGRSFALGQKPTFGGSAISVATGRFCCKTIFGLGAKNIFAGSGQN